MKLGTKYDLIIIDEVHRAVAPTYQELIDYLLTLRPDARILGLTATAYTMKGYIHGKDKMFSYDTS